jgi:ribulose-phosphate 3-epimerase
MEIIPAILAKSFQDFEQKITSPLMEIAPWIHIDVMDGTFTRQSCVSHPGLIPHEFQPSIELHLMVHDPLPFLEEWITHPAFKRAILHIEASCDHTRSALFANAHGKEIAYAINPSTPLEKLEPFLKETHHCLVMGVEPGASGQEFLGAEILNRGEILRQLVPNHHIAVDGGINSKTVPMLKKAGFESACAASALWNTDNPVTAYKRLMYI